MAAHALERHREVAPIAREWDELADRAGSAPFLRPGWFDAWMAAFPAARPTILAVRRGGELVGVLPLLHHRVNLTSPANSHTPLFGAVADGPGSARALARGLVAAGAARTDLRYLDAADPLLGELRAAARDARRPVIERVIARQPYVDLTSGFDAYEEGLPRKHRKEVGRLRRRLAAEGELAFEFADGTEGLDALLDEGFAIEGSGWKAEEGTAIAAVPEARRFYTDLARWAAGRGFLRLAFLRLDGRPLAFDLCIEAGGAFYALKGGYDIAYRRFGPGTVLTHESIARAFAAGCESYEFLGTDDAYKLNWTSTTRERVRVQVFSRSPRGLVQHAAWRYGRPFAKRAMARLGRG